MRSSRSRSLRVPLLAVAAAAVAAFCVGLALGAVSILSATESGGGTLVNTLPLPWLTAQNVGAASVPSPVPATVSGSAGAPTVLGASNQSFVVNAATAGDSSVRWNLSEISAAASVELELTFTLVNVSSGIVTTLVAFVESQSAPPSHTVVFTFYLDEGSGTATLDRTSLVVQECLSVGTCP